MFGVVILQRLIGDRIEDEAGDKLGGVWAGNGVKLGRE